MEMKSLKETKELEDNSFIFFIKKGYFKLALFCFGAVAQLGERVDGIHEVVGSIPSGSTKLIKSKNFILQFNQKISIFVIINKKKGVKI